MRSFWFAIFGKRIFEGPMRQAGENTLTTLEFHVMLAVIALGSDAHASAVAQHIERHANYKPSRTSVWVALPGLESRGFVKSRMGPPTRLPGGKRKFYWKVTQRGKNVLGEALDIILNLARAATSSSTSIAPDATVSAEKQNGDALTSLRLWLKSTNQSEPYSAPAQGASSILRYIRPNSTFDPDTLTVLGDVYDGACAQFCSCRTSPDCEPMADRIFIAAMNGESDPEKLWQTAVRGLKK